MRAYIYCTKAKPYLYKTKDTTYPAYPIGYHTDMDLKLKLSNTNELAYLNGKIVACFDLNKVEKMGLDSNNGLVFNCGFNEESQLSLEEIVNYVGDNYYYAWHIDNLQVFDKPMELSEFTHPFVLCNNYCDNNFKKSFCKDICSHNRDRERLNVWCDRDEKWMQPFTKAPQSWCYVRDIDEELCIIISIKPQWVEKILNGKKTIEVRKTCPREFKEV